MSDNRNKFRFDFDFDVICGTLLIIMCVGDPDIIDGIIHCLMK